LYDAARKLAYMAPIQQKIICSNQASKTADAFLETLTRITPNPEQVNIRVGVLGALEQLVLGTFNGQAQIALVGSSAAGTELVSSDLDVTITMPTTEDRVLLLRALLQQLQWATTGGWQHYNPAVSAVFLDATLEAVEGARIPIIKVTIHDGTLLDISFNQPTAIGSAQLIHNQIQSQAFLAPLCRLVKHWVEKRELPSPRHGGLGSYAWVLLVIFATQLDQAKAKEQTPTSHQPPLAPLFSSGRSLSSMLYGFFETLSEFDYSTVCSIRCGAAIPKEYRWHRPGQLPVLEDPADPTNNVAANISPATWVFLRAQFRDSARCLHPNGVMASDPRKAHDLLYANSFTGSPAIELRGDQLALYMLQPATPRGGGQTGAAGAAGSSGGGQQREDGRVEVGRVCSVRPAVGWTDLDRRLSRWDSRSVLSLRPYRLHGPSWHAPGERGLDHDKAGAAFTEEERRVYRTCLPPPPATTPATTPAIGGDMPSIPSIPSMPFMDAAAASLASPSGPMISLVPSQIVCVLREPGKAKLEKEELGEDPVPGWIGLQACAGSSNLLAESESESPSGSVLGSGIGSVTLSPEARAFLCLCETVLKQEPPPPSATMGGRASVAARGSHTTTSTTTAPGSSLPEVPIPEPRPRPDGVASGREHGGALGGALGGTKRGMNAMVIETPHSKKRRVTPGRELLGGGGGAREGHGCMQGASPTPFASSPSSIPQVSVTQAASRRRGVAGVGEGGELDPAQEAWEGDPNRDPKDGKQALRRGRREGEGGMQQPAGGHTLCQPVATPSSQPLRASSQPSPLSTPLEAELGASSPPVIGGGLNCPPPSAGGMDLTPCVNEQPTPLPLPLELEGPHGSGTRPPRGVPPGAHRGVPTAAWGGQRPLRLPIMQGIHGGSTSAANTGGKGAGLESLPVNAPAPQPNGGSKLSQQGKGGRGKAKPPAPRPKGGRGGKARRAP